MFVATTTATSASRSTRAIRDLFRGNASPTALHYYIATLPALPLVVHDWYDDLPQRALGIRSGWSLWGMAQNVCRAGHYSLRYLQADGTSSHPVPREAVEDWATLVYQPLGSITPASNFLGVDGERASPPADDGGGPSIPETVRKRSAGRHFLFLGCRFTHASDRMFVRELLANAAASHWAVLPEAPLESEVQFLAEQNIERIDLPLSAVVAALAEIRGEEQAQQLAACW